MTLILIAAIITGLVVLGVAYADTTEPKRAIGTGLVKFKGKGPEAWFNRYRQERRLHKGTAGKARLAQRALRQTLQADLYGTHWLERAFMCIHGFEGAWDDPNAPYWGGLQMDMSFQRAYGREYLEKFGTADKWPQSVQMAVAIKAYLSGRGFYPWPNTARYCDLLN